MDDPDTGTHPRGNIMDMEEEDIESLGQMQSIDEVTTSTLKRISRISLASSPPATSGLEEGSGHAGRLRKASVTSAAGGQRDLANIRRTSIRRVSMTLKTDEFTATLTRGTTATSLIRRMSTSAIDPKKIRDLILLDPVTPEAVVDALRRRYEADLIYVSHYHVGSASFPALSGVCYDNAQRPAKKMIKIMWEITGNVICVSMRISLAESVAPVTGVLDSSVCARTRDVRHEAKPTSEAARSWTGPDMVCYFYNVFICERKFILLSLVH